MVPGTVWLVLFFAIPTVTLVASSLYDPSGSFAEGYRMTWHWQNYTDAWSEYASKPRAFMRVTFPLSLPGVFAGVLLTFIPAAGDFINAQLLGTPRQYMIGNVIQSQFLAVRDYPTAAALSFILMAAILVIVLVFARILGTERLTVAG
jgi:ABC-type spermidine/putrescine transport system permease subunit I